VRLPNPTVVLRLAALAGAIALASAMTTPVPASADSTLSIGVIGQQNAAWAGARLGRSPTESIGSSGCAITAVTMMLRYYGITTDPGAFNGWLSANGGYAVDDQLIWDAVTAYSGGRVAFSGWLGPDLSAIENELDAAQPVVAEVRLGANQHFVLLTGYSTEGGCLDPHLHAGRPERRAGPRAGARDRQCCIRRRSIAMTSASAASGTELRYCGYFFRKAAIARACSGPRSTIRARPCISTHHNRRQSST
jgi:hypothetical protein